MKPEPAIMNAVFASKVVTKETTLEGSMRNDTGGIGAIAVAIRASAVRAR